MSAIEQRDSNQDLDEWTEWAAYNLAAGVDRDKVRAQMIAGGFRSEAVDALLRSLTSDPVFRATQRHAAQTRKWTSLMDALMALERQANDFTHVPRRANLSSQEFLELYYSQNKPVILTDVVTKWPAYRKWDLDYLADRYGQEIIQYQKGRSGGDFYRTFSNNKTEASFREYIDLIREEHETNDYYLIAHDRVLERPSLKPLVDDIAFDPRYFDATDTAGRLFFWLGPKGSMTHMHRDLGNVFLAQIKGRKQIKLVPAKQLHYVYNEFEYYSEANFDTEAFDDYPNLENAYIIRDVVAPGELLFIPVGWWHFIKSLDVTINVTMTNFCFDNDLPRIF